MSDERLLSGPMVVMVFGRVASEAMEGPAGVDPCAGFAVAAREARERRPAAEATRPGTKLLVVDGRRALVGSANLTHRALTANLEAGVLIEDHDLAADLEDHVRGLISSGTLVRTEQGP